MNQAKPTQKKARVRWPLVVLAGVVLLGAGRLALRYCDNNISVSGVEAGQLVPGFDPANVVAIRFSGTHNVRIQRASVDQEWPEPIAMDIAQFLDTFTHGTPLRRLDWQPGDNERFGFHPPALLVTIERTNGPLQIELGSVKASDGSAYLVVHQGKQEAPVQVLFSVGEHIQRALEHAGEALSTYSAGGGSTNTIDL